MDDETIFACGFKNCLKTYSTKYSLQRHYFIKHKKSKRFTCKVCRKILSSNQNLKEHSYTHSYEKPLICSFPACNQLFRQSSQLSAHKRIHKSSVIQAAAQRSEDLRVIGGFQKDFKDRGIGIGFEENGEQFCIPKLFEPDILRRQLDRIN